MVLLRAGYESGFMVELQSADQSLGSGIIVADMHIANSFCKECKSSR